MGTVDAVAAWARWITAAFCTKAVIAERAILRLINVPLSDGQFDALVSFTYNLGGGVLQHSTLRRKINREEHGEVPEQFMHWV